MHIITTENVNCQDCHRCVRACPVKAIRIEKGHAKVVEEKCIFCGKCVIECPQDAKPVYTQIAKIQEAFRNGRKVVVSLAPSFVAYFADYAVNDFYCVLLGMGFSAIEETARGAEVVSQLYSSYLNTTGKTMISSCCPVVVKLVENYYPELLDYLAPVVSPMVAHAKLLRKHYGEDIFVVFAGPCIAKMKEQAEYPELIDAVITFDQLRGWIETEKPLLADSVTGSVAGHRFSQSSSLARRFSIAGGLTKSFNLNKDIDLDTEFMVVSGIEECKDIFHHLSEKDLLPGFIEAMACSGGCIGGPIEKNVLCSSVRRIKVLEYARQSPVQSPVLDIEEVDFTRQFTATPIIVENPTESKVREILRSIGKFSAADEKNCGACGYNTCRDKAIAIFHGNAEFNMCIPYMRSKAESFANIIVDNSLNAIIAVNENMTVQEFNAAAERMFNCKREAIINRSLAEVMNCADFVAVANTGGKSVGKRVEYPKYGLVTEQMIVAVPDYGLIIGVITDVTNHESHAREIERMKFESVEKATEIINKQMHVAQEIAGLLGETTAETKSALLELIWLMKGDPS